MSATTGTRAEALKAWTVHYDTNTNTARERIAHMCEHGIPEGHVGEWVGACLALIPASERPTLTDDKGTDWYAETFGECQHGYIKPYCGQCAADHPGDGR